MGKSASKDKSIILNRSFITLFPIAFSGAAALIYEVIWIRKISLVMGSSTYAFTTMLAAFLSGLAIGSVFGGYMADKSKRIVRMFAVIEFGIGFSALIATALVFLSFPVYTFLFERLGSSFTLITISQFLVSFVVMIIPAVLMGMTFPVMVKLYSKGLKQIGFDTGVIYSANTFGAVAGAFSVGFILIPLFGVNLSIMVAVSLNILAALIVLLFFKP